MKANIISILTVLLCTSFISCKKSQVASEATLTVYVHHHEVPVPNWPIWIKKRLPNQSDLQFYRTNDGAFDQILISNTEAKVTFSGLRPGEYLIHARGLDPILRDSIQGTQAIIIADPPSDKSLYMPVSEF